jgi:hypothetical protein
MIFSFLKSLLYIDWISWILHFFIFFVLSRWSGIKWQWALMLVFGIEVWETADWAIENPIRWWIRLDTWLDILAGCAGIWIGLRKYTRKSK